MIRVFDRLGALQSTCEPAPGVEHALAWQPSGSIIATTQRLVDENNDDGGRSSESNHHVIFFERNGLRRYDFDLREPDLVVHQLAWNADSSVLAVSLSRSRSGATSDAHGDAGDVQHAVQLWHRNNYHWYLKQELPATERLLGLDWHPEQPLELAVLGVHSLTTYTLAWDTLRAPRADGLVGVLDGASTKLTPFRRQNVPPPMCSHELAPLHQKSTAACTLAFDAQTQHFARVFPDARVEVFEWARLVERGTSEIGEPRLVCEYQLGQDELGGSQSTVLQAAMVVEGSTAHVALLLTTRSSAGSPLVAVTMIAFLSASEQKRKTMVAQCPVATAPARLFTDRSTVFLLECASEDGVNEPADIYSIPLQPDAPGLMLSEEHMPFPRFCPWVEPWGDSLAGLTSNGRLYIGAHLVATDATSFMATRDFLIWTTHAHECKFISNADRMAAIHIETLRQQIGDTESAAAPPSRAVERGSRIVTVVPGTNSLVLQMPRGNLETVHPRPLVLKVVCANLDARRFRAAFLACRRHRIDLNVLHDHNAHAFRGHIATFLDQVREVDHINLFLTSLRDEDVTKTMYRSVLGTPTRDYTEGEVPSKRNEICDAIRSELERRDVFGYANSILTAHVAKSPADYEAALQLLVTLKAQDEERAEDAVKYIIFLSDANKLFDLALGMYNFKLALLIAQHSQKVRVYVSRGCWCRLTFPPQDPREFLPFLRGFLQLETFMQRHKVDDYLKRHDSALRNLASAPDASFEEVLDYTIEHSLYSIALDVYQNDSAKYKLVLEANAEHLMERHDYRQAGLLFALAGQPLKAMHAYQKAHAWQELFTLALGDAKRPASEIKALARDVGEDLVSRRRHADAGRVLLEYGRDVDAAVDALVEGTLFAEAMRLTTLYNRRELVETAIKPAALEQQSQMLEDCEELNEQLEKQVRRLDELREKRDANPGTPRRCPCDASRPS